MPLTRRSFLATLAAAAPLPLVVRYAHAAAVAHVEADPQALHALAEAVLPSELGKAGIERATQEFQQWMAGYREGAEVNHGYGTSRLRTLGPTPATRWTAQLDDLNARAIAAKKTRFALLPLPERVGIVREVLVKERFDRIPAVAEANHVAIALLAHFYDSPAATDLCYEAQIGKETCRPLATSSRKPLPLARQRS